MPKSKVKRLFIYLMRSLRLLIVAYMMGIANIVKEESRFLEDTHYKIEMVEEQEDDEPLEEI